MSGIPPLTLGVFLMRLRRLHLLKPQLTVSQAAVLDEISRTHEQVLQAWTINYGKKLKTELKSRLDSITLYLTECREDHIACVDNYRPEAFRRTVIEEIMGMMALLETKDDAAFLTTIDRLDNRLRSITEPSNFLWDQALKPVYPLGSFWWLYHYPSVAAQENAADAASSPSYQ